MHTGWYVHRTVKTPPDGARRWDSAYQLLLPWAMAHDAGLGPAPSHHQEDRHGSGSRCPCLDEPSATATDD